MTLTVGMANSSANDLFEAVAALCLASGAFIAWAGESYWLKALLVFVLAVQINVLIDWSRQDYIPALMNKVTDTREVEQLAEYVQEAQGPILADEYMGLIPLAGRRLYFQPFEYKQLQAANLWSEAPLIASIQREEFSSHPALSTTPLERCDYFTLEPGVEGQHLCPLPVGENPRRNFDLSARKGFPIRFGGSLLRLR